MAKQYRNWAAVTVTKTTTGTKQLFLQKTENDYRQGKEGKAPSNAALLLGRVMIHGSPDTDPEAVLKALKGATITIKGQSGKVRELGPAFLVAKEANSWTDPSAFNLEVPVVIEPSATYTVELNWQESNALGDSEQATIFVVVEGIEGSPEEIDALING
jgi:hypothetical protein